MRKGFFLIICILFITQVNRAQCTITVSTTLTPAQFLDCNPVTINAGASLYVNGNVSLPNGTTTVINNGSFTIGGNFTASGNSSFNLSGGGSTSITGNLSVSGNFSMSDGGAISVAGDASFGGSSNISGSGSITVAGTSTASGNTDVFGWTSGSCTGCTLNTTNPTPITLLEFKALLSNAQVSLLWSTATEVNNNYFTVERSSDATHFSYLSTIDSKAPNGNSTLKLDYQIFDSSPMSGISYYRLKQTDYDGTAKYFKTVSVTNGKKKDITFHVYPNPNQGQFKADFSGIENNPEVQILLHDMYGKLVYSSSFYSDDVSGSVNIIPEQKISKGIYTCTLAIDGVKRTVKVAVE